MSDYTIHHDKELDEIKQKAYEIMSRREKHVVTQLQKRGIEQQEIARIIGVRPETISRKYPVRNK